MKVRILAIAVAGLITLSVVAVGVSAVGRGGEEGASTAAAAQARDDGAAMAAFRFVCPFH